MCGVTALSCGRWFHMERDPTGRCPTRMWVTHKHTVSGSMLIKLVHLHSAASDKELLFQSSVKFLSITRSLHILHFSCIVLITKLDTSLHAGDQSNRRRLPSSCSYGLPCGVAPAHAGLLGEGAKRQAKVCTDCHNPGQAHQKPSQSQRAGKQLSMVSERKMWIMTANFTDKSWHAWIKL